MAGRLVLRSGGASAVLDPDAGGRIAALRVDGLCILVTDGSSSLDWGCYPMVPWAGRLRDGILRWRGREHHFATHVLPPHAIHGTLLDAAWDVVDAGPRDATLAANLGPAWPFGGRVVHRLALREEGLRMTLEVLAADTEFPAIVGWHPWFPRILRDDRGTPVGDPAVVSLHAAGMLRRGLDGIPDGSIARPIPPGPWDDCFVGVGRPPRVTWPGALDVRVQSDAPWWVVFTQHPVAVCVEPQTGPPNGLNTAEHAVVAPGAPVVAQMNLDWT